MVKFCPKCGEKLPENANFCKVCGCQISPGETVTTKKSLNTTQIILIVLGFILDFLSPIFGIIIGIYIMTRRTSSSRRIGTVMIVLGLGVWALNFMRLMS